MRTHNIIYAVTKFNVKSFGTKIDFYNSNNQTPFPLSEFRLLSQNYIFGNHRTDILIINDGSNFNKKKKHRLLYDFRKPLKTHYFTQNVISMRLYVRIYNIYTSNPIYMNTLYFVFIAEDYDAKKRT